MEKSKDLEGLRDGAEALMCGIARTKTWDAVHTIQQRLEPGMTEQQAIKMANSILAGMGCKKFWHKTHVRFGKSTIKSFDDPYDTEVVLGTDDIAYVDIGPIWDDIEGDAGSTVVIGQDPAKKKLVEETKVIFEAVKKAWQHEKLTGLQLLNFAESLTQKYGYILHPTYVKGHRLSEFPHKFYSNGSGLFDLNATPKPNRWVLEIQVCSSRMDYGAFYEDILG